jgi:hypothetical protein
MSDGPSQPYYGETQKKVQKPLPDLGPYKTIREIGIEAARAVAEKKKAAWEAARMRLDRATADCAAEHSSLPNNYWLDEYRARGHYGAALAILDLLLEL